MANDNEFESEQNYVDNFTQNNAFDQTNNYNSLYTPNSMQYSAENQQTLYQGNFHDSLSNTSFSMDIPPPSSNENQKNRCDDGFSSLSVDSTISSSSGGASFLMNHQKNPHSNSDSYNFEQKTWLYDKGFCRNIDVIFYYFL